MNINDEDLKTIRDAAQKIANVLNRPRELTPEEVYEDIRRRLLHSLNLHPEIPRKASELATHLDARMGGNYLVQALTIVEILLARDENG